MGHFCIWVKDKFKVMQHITMNMERPASRPPTSFKPRSYLYLFEWSRDLFLRVCTLALSFFMVKQNNLLHWRFGVFGQRLCHFA